MQNPLTAMKDPPETFDVIVIGGGVAGVCAAVQAARAGAKTRLVERSAQLGGTLTNGGIAKPGLFHAWGRQVIAGIGWRLVDEAVAEGGGAMPDFTNVGMPHWCHQPDLSASIFASVCDDAVIGAGVDLRLHTMLGALKRVRGRWDVVLCGKDGLYKAKAGIVIDCTGDANAAALAGESLRIPGVCQPATLSFCLGGYNLASLDEEKLNVAYRAAVAAGALQPEDACWHRDNPTVFGLLGKRGNNANHIAADSSARTSLGRTKLEVNARASVRRLVRWLRTQPGLEGVRVVMACPETGVRETATVVGLETITAHDYVSGRVWPESVCHAFYPIDVHGLDTSTWEQTFLRPGTVPTVPRGALVAKGRPGLLIAGRIISCDRLANSALRVQATCMATGQAAGALAALAVKHGLAPEAVPMRSLRALLRRHGAIVPSAGRPKTSI